MSMINYNNNAYTIPPNIESKSTLSYDLSPLSMIEVREWVKKSILWLTNITDIDEWDIRFCLSGSQANEMIFNIYS